MIEIGTVDEEVEEAAMTGPATTTSTVESRPRVRVEEVVAVLTIVQVDRARRLCQSRRK
jgi:hypothetical protein